ncbi:MAG TPA: TetR/AcrR family transcriptional regulator [Sandaracinaceae bacterium LLY-WYZ-13_1]|nr:TetR/AcrR family transcriptional regulator [Sandaracinaceae bacterium LLY-WYZ-13_1]
MSRDSPERRREPTTPQGRAIVTAICDAAALLLDRDGFQALTTNAIARVAGVSIGSLYQYFPDKEAIVVELARRLERDAYEAATQRASTIDAGDPRGVTAGLIDVLLDPALGGLATRRALLLQVPPAWVLPASGPTDTRTERLLATVMDTLALRDGPRDVMSFIVFHAVEGAIEDAILRRPEALGDAGFRAELFSLAWRYTAPDGASLAPPPPAPPAPWPEPPAELAARLRDEPAPPAAGKIRRAAPTTARGRASVEKILAAMLEQLTEGVWSAASARAVAKRAGVSPASLYRYFPDLRAMVSELARRREAQTLELLAAPLSERTDAPVASLLRTLVTALVDRARRDRRTRRALLAEVPQAWVRDVGDEVATALDDLFRRQLESRATVRGADPARLATIVRAGLGHCLESAIVVRPELLDHPAFADELVTLGARYLLTRDAW